MENKEIFLRIGAAFLFVEILAVCAVKYRMYNRRKLKYLGNVKQLQDSIKFKAKAYSPVNESGHLPLL